MNDKIYEAYKTALEKGEALTSSYLTDGKFLDIRKDQFLREVKSFLEVSGCVALAGYFDIILLGD